MNTVLNLINLDYLQLMSDNDKDMELTMLEMLLDELPSEFEKMQSFCKTENWEELNKVAHKMKTTLAFVGNEEMTNTNLTIEQTTKHISTPTESAIFLVKNNIEKFGELLPEILTELERVIGEY